MRHIRTLHCVGHAAGNVHVFTTFLMQRDLSSVSSSWQCNTVSVNILYVTPLERSDL